MTRYTQKSGADYTVTNVQKAINRLGRLEDFFEKLCADKEKATAQIAALHAQGKEKSVTCKQLFARKLKLLDMIASLEIYMNADDTDEKEQVL